jgi:hypothetical protein
MTKVSSYLKCDDGLYAHWCPGCEGLHYIPTDGEGRPNWSFDGNVEIPTFNPSVKINYNGPDAGQMSYGRRAPAACCHYFLHSGVLQFCGDSTHSLAGKSVPLPELPEATL